MFRKTKTNKDAGGTNAKKETGLSIITQDMHILGNLVSEGTIDFNGTIDGNIRCHTVTVRPHGTVKGELLADNVFIFGKVQGLIRAKIVHLYADCHVEGIVMHETLTIEDGAFLDGKCKRTDKIAEQRPVDAIFENSEEDASSSSATLAEGKEFRMLDNIRLIRS